MNPQLELLRHTVDRLRFGGVETKEGRATCLVSLKRSVAGRHKFWDGIVRPYPVVRKYMEEDIAFNLLLVDFIATLLHRVRELEEEATSSRTLSGNSSCSNTKAAFL